MPIGFCHDFLDLLPKLYKVILTPISLARAVAHKTPEVIICERSRAVHLASANRGLKKGWSYIARDCYRCMTSLVNVFDISHMRGNAFSISQTICCRAQSFWISLHSCWVEKFTVSSGLTSGTCARRFLLETFSEVGYKGFLYWIYNRWMRSDFLAVARALLSCVWGFFVNHIGHCVSPQVSWCAFVIGAVEVVVWRESGKWCFA